MEDQDNEMDKTINDEQRLRLLDAMLSVIDQDALGTPLGELAQQLPSDRTMRDELRLLLTDAMESPYTTDGPIGLIEALARRLSSELMMMGLGVEGDWPAKKGE